MGTEGPGVPAEALGQVHPPEQSPILMSIIKANPIKNTQQL